MKKLPEYKVTTFLISDGTETFFDSKEKAIEYGKAQVKTGKVAFLLERVTDNNKYIVVAEIRWKFDMLWYTKEGGNMSKADIAKAIAARLLDFEMLDLHNFLVDSEALLECTKKIILEQLENYIIVSGTLLLWCQNISYNAPTKVCYSLYPISQILTRSMCLYLY